MRALQFSNTRLRMSLLKAGLDTFVPARFSSLRAGKAAGPRLVQRRAGKSDRSDEWLGPSPKPATTAGDPGD